jgi:hypothetical protein
MNRKKPNNVSWRGGSKAYKKKEPTTCSTQQQPILRCIQKCIRKKERRRTKKEQKERKKERKEKKERKLSRVEMLNSKRKKEESS